MQWDLVSIGDISCKILYGGIARVHSFFHGGISKELLPAFPRRCIYRSSLFGPIIKSSS
jgi:hypothetical protein